MTMEPRRKAARTTSRVAKPGSKIRGPKEKRVVLLHKLSCTQPPIISRIPPSVLSHIFWLATCPHNPEHGARTPGLIDDKGLFRLRSVCSHWRRITQASPQLWTSLTLVQKESQVQTRATDYVAFVKLYCLNAAAISVYISDLHALKRATIDGIMKVLLEEYPRKLESLCVGSDPDGSLCRSILKYAKKKVEFTRLKELRLTWERFEIQPQGGAAFRNSPRLRTLLLHAGESQQIPFEFPRGQITTLKLYEASPEYTFQLLSHCPRLTKCKISHHDGNGEPVTPRQEQTISMRFVQKLTWFSLGLREPALYAPDPQPVDPQFFLHFRFPDVRVLKWDAPLPSEEAFVRNFFAAMRKVERLKFWPSQSESDCLGQHLDLFRNLTTLDLSITTDPFVNYNDDRPSRWLYRLTVRNGGDNLLPQLQELNLIVGDILPHMLVVLLYSRRNGPVDWPDHEQGPEHVILPPYDPTSTHWQHHTRLVEFSAEPYNDRISIDWTSSPHYGEMRAMMEEAEEVEGFGDDETGLNQILF